MAKRPQFKIKIFGILIEYWGSPSRRLTVAVLDTSQARKLTRIVLGILLLKAVHDLAERMLSAYEPPYEARFALARSITAGCLVLWLVVRELWSD